jgi:hypothetical protein
MGMYPVGNTSALTFSLDDVYVRGRRLSGFTLGHLRLQVVRIWRQAKIAAILLDVLWRKSLRLLPGIESERSDFFL